MKPGVNLFRLVATRGTGRFDKRSQERNHLHGNAVISLQPQRKCVTERTGVAKSMRKSEADGMLMRHWSLPS